MTFRFVDLIGAYAKRNKVALDPNWMGTECISLNVDDSAALASLCDELGWKCAASSSKPRAHHFPLLTFVAEYGWTIAESWANEAQIRLITTSGVVEVDWTDSITFWTVYFPKLAKIEGTERAIDIFWSAILKRKTIIVDATIATIVINLIALATSIYSMQVYDRVIPRAGYATLVVLTAGMVFALIVDMVIRTTNVTFCVIVIMIITCHPVRPRI